jgi:hypothetical protein
MGQRHDRCFSQTRVSSFVQPSGEEFMKYIGKLSNLLVALALIGGPVAVKKTVATDEGSGNGSLTKAKNVVWIDKTNIPEAAEVGGGLW